ncbi:MAG: GGDEF domain-containing protein [Actinomycetota bacterium]|nr:GGDEF domain-containing protein [Actinomycetota bacterium]
MSSDRSRRALERIEIAHARSIVHLQTSGPERALLVELLEASCLLELAKIEPSTLDPAVYLQLSLDVLTDLYPIAGCAASIVEPGGRAIDVSSGGDAKFGKEHPLVAGEVTLGVLFTGPLSTDIEVDDGFFGRAAALVAQGLATAIDSERLRRDAATETASRIAAEVHDDVAQRLEDLVDALASFPGAVGAELLVDHSAVGPPISLRAGFWDDDGHPHAIESVTVELARVGHLVGRLRSVDAGAVEADDLRVVLERLSGSLDRLADTQRLREEAETEPLTGLGNRRRLERALTTATARAQWYGEQVAVLLIDIDRLKAVNDGLGHDAGDAVIVACADALRERVRTYDECARFGGDEFVVVAPVPDVLDALRLADGIRLAIRHACRAVLPEEWEISATVGIALYPDSGRDPEALMRAADVALYRAKQEGRDGVVVADANDEPPHPPRRRFLKRSGA